MSEAERQPEAGRAEAVSPYHAGERAVQRRAGVEDKADRLSRGIRDYMPDQHREFFAELPFLLIGGRDRDGQLWASALTGRPGFVHSPDPRSLRIDALPMAGDPLSGNLRPGAAVGLLGIQLHTRRRNRMNGRIAAMDEAGFTVAVDQSFGNCAKYIQARTAEPLPRPAASEGGGIAREGARLSPEALSVIARADTFFIATATPAAGGASLSEGVDVNHRGVPPGSIRIAADAESGATLSIPDLPGNNAFMTFGNIEANPRCGVLFFDFERGGLISLTGFAEILWDEAAAAEFPGASRVLRFRPSHGVRLPGALPFRWSAPEIAPQFRFED